jgi:hypothetical protein
MDAPGTALGNQTPHRKNRGLTPRVTGNASVLSLPADSCKHIDTKKILMAMAKKRNRV